jgi:outer membrane lipoprotein-sorting protein
MVFKLEKEVRFLKVYALAATLVFVVLFASAFKQQSQNQKFEEIDVERINIVEKDGKLRMVISNRERQHPGIVDGKLIPREGGRPPGMIFFNHRGDECGGLIFGNNGDKGHFVSLTFDKSRQDQTVGIQHLESDSGQYFAGLRIWDRPHTSIADMLNKYEAIKKMQDEDAKKAAIKELSDKGELGTNRIIIGKSRNKSAMIELSDTNGKPRIRISVDPSGDPRMDFLDESGEVIFTLPGEGESPKP